MPLTPASLIAPTGELPADLLPVPPEEADAYATPRDYLMAMIAGAGSGGGWAARAAEAAPDSEDAQRAFVYARAFRARFLRATSDPAAMGLVGEGNTQYLQSQINAWRDEAARWDAEFARLSAVSSLPPTFALPGSGPLGVSSWS